jgi:hypothetical protein
MIAAVNGNVLGSDIKVVSGVINSSDLDGEVMNDTRAVWTARKWATAFLRP